MGLHVTSALTMLVRLRNVIGRRRTVFMVAYPWQALMSARSRDFAGLSAYSASVTVVANVEGKDFELVQGTRERDQSRPQPTKSPLMVLIDEICFNLSELPILIASRSRRTEFKSLEDTTHG